MEMKEIIEKLKENIAIDQTLLKNFINLDPVEKEMVRRWRNNPEVRKWMYNDHEISPEEHQNFIERLKTSKKEFYYLVYEKDKAVGVLTLTRLDLKNRNAYLGLYANPEERIAGAGMLIGKTALKLAFEMVSLHTLKLEVLEDNQKAIKLYKKLGFSEEGRLRQFIFKDAKWKDVIVMGIINPYKPSEET